MIISYNNLYKLRIQKNIMGTALVRMRIMPESPDTILEEIQKETENILKQVTNMKVTFEKEPIAFGLVALIAQFAVDEKNEIDPIQDKIKAIPHVNGAEIIDFRRAFG